MSEHEIMYRKIGRRYVPAGVYMPVDTYRPGCYVTVVDDHCRSCVKIIDPAMAEVEAAIMVFKGVLRDALEEAAQPQLTSIRHDPIKLTRKQQKAFDDLRAVMPGNWNSLRITHDSLYSTIERAIDAFRMRVKPECTEPQAVDWRSFVQRAVRGLRFSTPFRHENGDDPHPLDCTLAGRVAFVFGVGMTRAIKLCRQCGEDPEWQPPKDDDGH